jgi:hypothetical protein
MAIETINITGVALSESGTPNIDRITLKLSAEPHPKWREAFWVGLANFTHPDHGSTRPTVVGDAITLDSPAFRTAALVSETKELVAKTNEALGSEIADSVAHDESRAAREVDLQALLG